MENNGKQFRKRNAILACLRQSVEHPSAEMLYQMLQKEHSDISRASVYRNLAYFKEHGLIFSLGTVNDIERFDGCLDPHVHFVCSCCGSVTDVPDLPIPENLSREASRSLGCRVDDARLMLTGLCKTCKIVN